MALLFPHKKSYYTLLAALFMLFLSVGNAQNVINEYSNFECSHSKLITLPLTDPSDTPDKKATLPVEQTVFYEHRDQFSYWYKVVAKEDQVINCIITPINKDDSYVLYIYKYAKNDFCNKVFYGKIDPLKPSFFLNNKDNKESIDMSELKFKAKEGEGYYVCVLNTSPTNCGHILNLTTETDTVNIKAIHYPCTEEEEEAFVASAAPIKNKVIETNPNEKKVIRVVDLSVRDEADRNKKVDSRLMIKEELTGNEIKIESTGENIFKMEIQEGKAYLIECLATGYKKFIHSVVISEYVHPDSSNFDILLRALKAGDNFVMNNIYFYPNTYALKKESDTEISYLLKFLTNNPDVKIELQGHTNGNNKIGKNKAYKSMGPEWNYKGSSKNLSQLRAEAIKKYLVKNGIDTNRIITKGFGGDKPIVENPKTLELIQKNVRVEVLIL